jgi:hypothetical protein
MRHGRMNNKNYVTFAGEEMDSSDGSRPRLVLSNYDKNSFNME